MARSRIRKWGWPIGIIVSVALSVGGAYFLGTPQRTIAAIDTFGSLLLSVLLLYIYDRQNKILENHEKVLQSQYEAQEASDIAPNIYIDNWNLSDESGELSLSVENNGGGGAHDLRLVTEMVTASADTSASSKSSLELVGRSEVQIDHFLGSNECNSYEEAPTFALSSIRNEPIGQMVTRLFHDLIGNQSSFGERWMSENSGYSFEFEPLSENILSIDKAEEGMSRQVAIDIFLEYQDSVGSSDTEEVVRSSIALKSPSTLVKGRGKLTVTPLHWGINVSEVGFYGSEGVIGPEVDTFHLEAEATGDIETHIASINADCRIWDGSDWIDSISFFSDYQSAFEIQDYAVSPEFNHGYPTSSLLTLDPSGFQKSRTLDEPMRLLGWNSTNEISEKPETLTLYKITEQMINSDFNQPIEVLIYLVLKNNAGNERFETLSRFKFCYQCGDDCSYTDIDEIIEIDQPTSFEKLERSHNILANARYIGV